MSQNVVDIDGGVMEGGGQILRMAMAFSALLKKPIRVFNIRAGRSSPGLRPQHLAGLKLVQDICNGELTGGEIGSTEITFRPGRIRSGRFSADPGTAGSIMLLFQVSFPCLLYAPEPAELHLKGGTNVDMAPQIDHTLTVFRPIIEKFGIKFDCNLIRRGYFPKGGGETLFKVYPVPGCMSGIELQDPGTVTNIFGRSYVAGVLPIKMAHGMADAACRVLKPSFPDSTLKIDRVKESPHLAFGNGSGIVVTAKTSTGCLFSGSALGRKGATPEQVGEFAAKEMVDDIKSGSCVDQYTQDQLIILMALAKGTSRVRCGNVTLHTETAIHIAEKMTKVKFQVDKGMAGFCTIECCGLGLCR